MDFDLDRRTFLKVMGGAGLPALLGCGRRPVKRLVSHVTPQQELVPGLVNWYASVCRECPAGCGIVVANMEGRPIKIEGNPLHPLNAGALCARGQAALQRLYNPERVREPLQAVGEGQTRTVGWEEVLGRVSEKIQRLEERGALDRAALVVPRLSGALTKLLATWGEDFPGLGIYEYEAISYDPLIRANEISFGRSVLPLYRIDRADLLVSFGADFLETWIQPVNYAAAFSRMRTYRDGSMGTFVYVGPRQSLTAAGADEQILIRPGTYGALALGVIRILMAEGWKAPSPGIDRDALRKLVEGYDPRTVAEKTDVAADRVRSIARTIARSRRSLILPGGVGSTGSNATRNMMAVNLLNAYLGNYESTIDLPARNPSPVLSTAEAFGRLIERMRAGGLDLLILGGVNPAYSLPPSYGFREAVEQVDAVVSCAETFDETTAASDYVLPIHSFLESWDDYEPVDGIHGLIQPMVRPLGNSKPFGEILIEISRRSGGSSSEPPGFTSYHDFLREAWKELARSTEPAKPFREFWEESLRSGGHFRPPETAPAVLSRHAYELQWEEPRVETSGTGRPAPSRAETDHGEKALLVVYPSLARYDGRGANRPWLQELQDPMLQNVWSSVVEVSEEKAARMELKKGDVVRLSSRHGAIDCPVTISRHAHGEIAAIAMGQGHLSFGRYADGIGVNPVELLPASYDDLSGVGAYLCVKVRIEKTGKRTEVPTPEGLPYDKGRGIAREVSIREMRDLSRKEPENEEHEFKELVSPHEHPDYRWGMAIDLHACTGCNACVVACYAENNIAVVGKELYAEGREMTWIRIERYYSQQRPEEVRFIPLLCQQCDNAPCETVCPVYATYHTHEGLNAQIYNRCVGTRYCANNCPYVVRRFNWFTYHLAKPLNLQLNPNVTVRSKGIMEKCTFCIQRIVAAEDRAKDEGRKVRDGEVTPACAQTCPTRAITFGNLKDPDSEVSRKARNARGYRILEYLNTKPAITYLKKIRNEEDLA